MQAGRYRPTLRERYFNIRRRFWEWLLEDRATHGLGGPPNGFRHSPRFTSRRHGMSNSLKEFGMQFQNDAFDIGIWKQYDEQKSELAFTIAAEDFRKLALWYLWRWAWGEWFGLRRRLFYWQLHKRIERRRRK